MLVRVTRILRIHTHTRIHILATHMRIPTALIHMFTIRTHMRIRTLGSGVVITAVIIGAIVIRVITVDTGIVPTATAALTDIAAATGTGAAMVIAVVTATAASMLPAVDLPDPEADLRAQAGLGEQAVLAATAVTDRPL